MICQRLRGGSCRDCECKLPNEGGWLPCPPAEEVVQARAVENVRFSLTGDLCMNCGGANMQRAGACMVCLDCGTSGGCG